MGPTEHDGAPTADQASNDATDALERLYRAEHRAMVDLAHLLVGDAGRAEELVHDAFLRVAPHLGRTGNHGAYLRTTVVNLCRDHHRRTARARQHPRPREEVVLPDAVPATSTEVWHALQRLPERQRTALVLRYWLDLDHQEVARLLGARPGTARSLVHRGLAALQEVLPHDR